MDNQNIEIYDGRMQRAFTIRDAAFVCFQHWKLMLLIFFPILLGAVVSAMTTPKKYEAETEILVKRERADPVVTPATNSSPDFVPAVSEEDLNSEVELLRGHDLLEKVVMTCGLAQRLPESRLIHVVRTLRIPLSDQKGSSVAVPLAVRALQKQLKVDSIRKTNLIRVTYQSTDPKLAASVLKALTEFYLEKHLEVQRPPGTFAFFEQQTSRYWDALQDAEKRLADFNRSQNTVSAQNELAATELKLADFQGNSRQTRAAIAAATERIKWVTMQLASTPDRLMTQVHTNSVLTAQLKANLLTLELKRSELTSKYPPTSRALQEVEAQITATHAALTQEQSAPLQEETTDRNPTYQWLMEDLTKSRTELVSLRAQGTALQQQVNAYRSDLLALDAKQLEQQDLIRNVKLEEANYLLYLSKREEARISDALDQKRIVDASIVESPTVPALPIGLGPALTLAMGFLVATCASVGGAFARQFLTPSFRTPDDVEMFLGVPLLASFPKEGEDLRLWPRGNGAPQPMP